MEDLNALKIKAYDIMTELEKTYNKTKELEKIKEELNIKIKAIEGQKDSKTEIEKKNELLAKEQAIMAKRIQK